MKITIISLTAAAVAMAGPAGAQVSLDNKVLRESVRVASDGSRTVTLSPARTITPGSVAVYVMTFRNGGPKAATNLQIANAIPAGIRYAGEGQNSPEPQVSVDRGQTFGRLTDLKVRSANGAVRAAQFADVTNVRWTIAGPLAPGASGNVSYRGVLQ